MSRLLAIAGPSCSGKSTIARLLATETGARLLHLDAYWRRGCERPVVNGAPSHERPEQYDGEAWHATSPPSSGNAPTAW